MDVVAKTHSRQMIHGYKLRLAALHAEHLDEADRNVLECGKMQKKVVLLEHHAEGTALFRNGIFCCLEELSSRPLVTHQGAIHVDVAAVDVLELVDAAEHGAFAAPGCSENADDFSCVDVQIDGLKNFDAVEVFAQRSDFDDGVHITSPKLAQRSVDLLAG